MTDYIKRRTAFAVAIALVCALLALCAVGVWRARAEDERVVLENGAVETIEKTYTVGDTFTLPTHAAIRDGGETFDASIVLRMPNGNGVTGVSATLEDAGLYTLEYRAHNGAGALLTAKQTFSAVKPLFAVTSGKSSAAYVTEKKLADDVTGAAGVSVSLSKGDTLTFNQVLDFSTATAGEPFIRFYVAPQQLFNYDAGRINFILTDPYDPTNVLTIAAKRMLLVSTSSMHRTTYVTANVVGQPETGLEKRDASDPQATFIYQGEHYRLHQNDMYGTGVAHSMYGGDGAPANGDPKYQGYLGHGMALSFDNATRSVYAFAQDSTTPVLVAPLTDLQIFDEAWKGFTDNKAVLSIRCDSYRTLSSNFVITELAGVKLDGGAAVDRSGPMITVDTAGYTADNLPTARVGEAYPLFAAEAVDDVNGRLPVSVSVWSNYSSTDTRTRETCDGKTFTPAQPGTYTIVYSATDYAGNATDLPFEIEAVDGDPLTLALGAGDESGTAGKKVTLKTPTLSGGSGAHKLAVTATLDADTSVSYPVEAVDGVYAFVPLTAGAYTVTYTYGDWLGEKTQTYALNVGAATGAYIADEAAVPKYMIQGATYRIPALFGYAFDGGAHTARCEATVLQDGTETAVDGDAFKVTASKTVTLRYRLSYSGGEADVKEYDIPVVTGTGLGVSGKLDLAKYFVNVEGEPTGSNRVQQPVAFTFEDDEDERLIATVTNDSAESMAYGVFDFVNPVLASTLNLRFRFSHTNFLTASVLVTDSADASKQALITFGHDSSWRITFRVNNGPEYTTNYTGSSEIVLTYNETRKVFTAGNATAPIVNADGSAFEGFGASVYLTFRIDGVYNTAASGKTQTGGIRFVRINNQSLSRLLNDVIPPEASAYISEGNKAFGSTAVIPVFYVGDVLDPTVTLGVRVLDPDGNPVTSTDGVLLDGTQDLTRSYTVALNKYGNYAIMISGQCGTSTRHLNTQYGIAVYDLTAPVVTFGEAAETAKKGDTVAFPSVSVQDNRTEAAALTVTRYLQLPSGKIVNITAGDHDSFVASQTGVYRLLIYVQDEAGNVSVGAYAIAVS